MVEKTAFVKKIKNRKKKKIPLKIATVSIISLYFNYIAVKNALYKTYQNNDNHKIYDNHFAT
jgi:hypothetical protein